MIAFLIIGMFLLGVYVGILAFEWWSKHTLLHKSSVNNKRFGILTNKTKRMIRERLQAEIEKLKNSEEQN